jgi:hypothetical protein
LKAGRGFGLVPDDEIFSSFFPLALFLWPEFRVEADFLACATFPEPIEAYEYMRSNNEVVVRVQVQLVDGINK